jgi:peptidoglycan hydrolase CwlO-like protein
MKKRLVIIAVLAVGVVLMSLGGCKDKPADTESDIVKTDAEYKAQAEKEITKDNLQEELDKLEESVDKDTDM